MKYFAKMALIFSALVLLMGLSSCLTEDKSVDNPTPMMEESSVFNDSELSKELEEAMDIELSGKSSQGRSSYDVLYNSSFSGVGSYYPITVNVPKGKLIGVRVLAYQPYVDGRISYNNSVEDYELNQPNTNKTVAFNATNSVLRIYKRPNRNFRGRVIVIAVDR